jgi:bacteriorhodopsin
MKRDSFTAMFAYGIVIVLLAWAMATLTGTGIAGLYAFSFVGMIAVPLYLMWPEQARFARRRPTPAAPIRQKRRNRHPSRPGALQP